MAAVLKSSLKRTYLNATAADMGETRDRLYSAKIPDTDGIPNSLKSGQASWPDTFDPYSAGLRALQLKGLRQRILTQQSCSIRAEPRTEEVTNSNVKWHHYNC